MIRIYEYKSCNTCKKALKFLDAKEVEYERVPIVEKPPTFEELKAMLAIQKSKGGSIKRLFNTSGQMYREMRLGEKIQDMTEDQALKLLSKNGKLVKRPFVIKGESGVVGFKEDEWKNVLFS